MKWSLFSLIAGTLIMGNVLVHAQSLPSIPSMPDVPTRIPDEALRTLNVAPDQIAQLPTQAQQEIARQQASMRDTILRQSQEQIAASRGGIALPSNEPSNNGQPAATSTSSPSGAGQSALNLSRSYLSSAHDLNEVNIAQTLSLATAADIRLWKGYYESLYTKVEETKRSYERIKTSLERYKDQLDSMLNQLPTTILSCTR
jgi:hypothetical protein